MIEPGEARLTVEDGRLVEQAYQVYQIDADGERSEVTGEATLRIDDRQLGDFEGALFRASGVRGGRGVVTARHGELSGTAAVVVRIDQSRVVDPAPADAAALFEAAADDAALAPQLLYPEDGTTVPPNLGDFEAHWLAAGGADLFALTLASEHAEVTVYTAATAAGVASGARFCPRSGAWSPTAPQTASSS